MGMLLCFDKEHVDFLKLGGFGARMNGIRNAFWDMLQLATCKTKTAVS